MYSLRSISTKLLFAFAALVAVAAVPAHAQDKIQPEQINWPGGAAGCVYAPGTNTCITPSSGTGGVNGIIVTANTTAACGQFIRDDASGAITITMPAVATGCSVAIMRGVAAGTLTISPGGASYDGVTTQLPQGASVLVWTDGTGYHSNSPIIPGSHATYTPGLQGNTLDFAGSGSSTTTTRILVAGLVNDGNVGANTGTDSTAVWTSCQSALTAGQVCYFPPGTYRIVAGGPTITTSGTGIQCSPNHQTTIFTSSSSAVITGIQGTNTSSTVNNASIGGPDSGCVFRRAVPAAANAIGISVQYAVSPSVLNNWLLDTGVGFDTTYSPTGGYNSYSNNLIESCGNGVAAGAGPNIGFALHGGSTGFVTQTVSYNNFQNNCGGVPSSYFAKTDGQIQDLNLIGNFAGSATTAIYLAGNTGQDVHITDQTWDHCFTDCIYINVSGANSITLSGGQNWITIADTGQTAGIEVDNTPNVSIADFQCWSNKDAPCFYVHGSSATGVSVAHNRCSIGMVVSGSGHGQCFSAAGGAQGVLDDNVTTGNQKSGFTLSPYQFAGSSGWAITGNTAGGGAGSAMFSFDATSNNNCCWNVGNTNFWGLSSDAGTGNQFASGSGITGATSGQVLIAGSATTATSSIALGNTGSDIPQLSSGLLAAAVLPLATSGAFGAIKPDGSSCTVTAGVLTCPGGTGATSIPLCSDSSGSGTAQVCTTSPSFTPTAGSVIAYSTTTANTGTGLTINVNSLGAKSVAKWQGTTTLAANDILAGKYVLMTYDGTNWETSTIGNAPAGGGAGNYVNLCSLVTLANATCSSGTISVTASSSSFTISAIPGTYINLRVTSIVKGSAIAEVDCQFNADTGTNYAFQKLQLGGGASAPSNSGSGNVSSTSIGCGDAGTLTGGGTMVIPFYASALPKMILADSFVTDSVSSGTNIIGVKFQGAWNNTAAITSIKFIPTSGTFSAGTKYAIYGEN